MDVGPVGRSDELARLTGLVRQVAQGRGGLAWVRGEPGAGSSTLIDVVAAQATDCLVLRGAADELAQAFPLSLMAGVFGDCAEWPPIAKLLRGETDGAVDPVLAAGERILALVDRLCADRPVVLVAEDLQWADEPSLLVWSRLARSVGQIPLLLIGTAQPVPHRDTVVRLRDLVGEDIELGPLSDADVRTIAGRVLDAEPGPRLSTELARAGGNPLFTRELVDALVRDGLIEITDRVAEFTGESGAVPGSLAVAIGRRLQFPSADVLRVAALLGNDFDLTELAIVSGKSVVELSGVVEQAIAAGAVRESGSRLRFRHELIRQVLVEQTSEATRVALHLHLAEQLATAGRGVDVVARHLLAVPDIADGWVRRWLAEVPEAKLYAVPQVAAELLGRVLSTADDPELAARAARVAFWLGRDDEAYRRARDIARRTTDAELAARMNLLAVRSAGRAGRMEEALRITREPIFDGVSPATRAALGAWSAVMLVGTGAVEEAGAVVRAALDEAKRGGNCLTLGYALHASTLVAAPPIALHRIDEALSVLGDDPESMDLRLLLINNRLTYLAGLGRWEEAESALAAALVLAERAGTFRGAIMLATAAEVSYKRGNWDDALLHLGGIDTEFAGNGSNLNPAAIGALVALHRGEQAKAEEYLRITGIDAWSARNPANWRLTAAWALQAEVDGDPQAALGLMTTWLDPVPVPGQRTRQEVLPHLVRLALAVDDRETAASATKVAREDADTDLQIGSAVAALCCEAQLNDDVDGLLQAARDYGRYGWPLQQALALEEAAARLAKTDASRARATFVDAMKIYEDLGATWDLRRAESRLRALGIRRGPRSLHRRATSGWDALTPAEVRIAGLVAKGLSNPDIAGELFLSRRTVQTHVSNILTKLGLSSRLEIVRGAVAIPTRAG
ncbi:MAG: hypothetical protein QOF58_1419 [Pseudonocardiales bacterium]|nr:hypothetical protein [Pseudonocardiales bacterium]